MRSRVPLGINGVKSEGSEKCAFDKSKEICFVDGYARRSGDSSISGYFLPVTNDGY
jgi:hypothetical protein